MYENFQFYITENKHNQNNQKNFLDENSENRTLFSDDEGYGEEEHEYVLNTNSKKFHLPTCDSVSKMSEKNRQNYTGSRDELIAEGYTPCGSCNP